MFRRLGMEELADMQPLLQIKKAMITAWNEGVVNKVVDFYSEDAVLFDDDGGQVVSGKNEIEEYLSITFELSKSHSYPQIILNGEEIYADGGFVMDGGTYQWPKMYRGRYLHKWQFQDGSWRMVAHYFTTEKGRSTSLFKNQGNKENNSK